MAATSPIWELQQRIAPLKKLVDRGIPCILWGDDALKFAHNVTPICYSDLHILVPDTLLDSAGATLVDDGAYDRTTIPSEKYVELYGGLNAGEYAFPRSVRLVHRTVPCRWAEYSEVPRHILLVPESYYGFEVQSHIGEFKPFCPPLDLAAYRDVLVPEFHTMLEGLVHFTTYPPTGHEHCLFSDNEFITGLLEARMRGRKREEVQQEIMDEIETEDCAWFMQSWFKRKYTGCGDLESDDAYKQKKALRLREGKSYITSEKARDMIKLRENITKKKRWYSTYQRPLPTPLCQRVMRNPRPHPLVTLSGLQRAAFGLQCLFRH